MAFVVVASESLRSGAIVNTICVIWDLSFFWIRGYYSNTYGVYVNRVHGYSDIGSLYDRYIDTCDL